MNTLRRNSIIPINEDASPEENVKFSNVANNDYFGAVPLGSTSNRDKADILGP